MEENLPKIILCIKNLMFCLWPTSQSILVQSSGQQQKPLNLKINHSPPILPIFDKATQLIFLHPRQNSTKAKQWKHLSIFTWKPHILVNTSSPLILQKFAKKPPVDPYVEWCSPWFWHLRELTQKASPHRRCPQPGLRSWDWWSPHWKLLDFKEENHFAKKPDTFQGGYPVLRI